MYIMVKGANYASNNIGKVHLPITDPDVLEYFRKLSAGQSQQRQDVVNDFVKGLKEFKIWDKIQYLQIPKFGSAANANINLKNNGFKITFPSDAIYNSSGVNLTGKDFSQSIELNSIGHLGAYNTTLEGDNSVGRAILSIASVPLVIGRRIANNFNDAGASYGQDVLTAPNHQASVGSMLLGIDNNANKITVICDGEFTTKTLTTQSQEITTVDLTFGNYNSTCPATASYGLFTIGEPLSNDQLVVYDALITQLMNRI